MATATERIPVLVSGIEKKQIAKLAQSAGLSMGEYLRRAAAAFRPAEDEQALEKMIHQMNKTTVQANRALESALAFVKASNQRIAAMEGQAVPHKKQRKAA